MEDPPLDGVAATRVDANESARAEADAAAGPHASRRELEESGVLGSCVSSKSWLIDSRTGLALRGAGASATSLQDYEREVEIRDARMATESFRQQQENQAKRSDVSNWGTVLVLAKSTVGGTLIVLPAGFMRAGWIPASLLLASICAMEVYCMILLTQCVRKLGGRAGFGDIAMTAMGLPLAIAVDVSMVLSQVGFVCGEMLYFAKNLTEPLNELGVRHVPSVQAWIFIQLALVVPMSWIRRLKYFAIPNLISNITVLSALTVLAMVSIIGLAEGKVGNDLQAVGDTEGILLFAGTSVFAFACINFVIPIYEEHRDKDKFEPVLSGTLSGVCLLFIVFGALSYFRYGANTKEVVTLNLPHHSALGDIIPFAFALASLLNVPLFLFPATTLMESRIFKPGPSRTFGRKCLKNLLRTATAVVCAFVAYVGADNVQAMVALIGSVCCVPLAFIYPVICHFKLCKPGVFGAMMDVIIGLVGVFLFVLTTRQAIIELTEESTSTTSTSITSTSSPSLQGTILS